MNTTTMLLQKGSFLGTSVQIPTADTSAQAFQKLPPKFCAKKGGRGGASGGSGGRVASGGFRAVETLSSALASQVDRNTALNESLLEAKQEIAELEKEKIVSNQKVKGLMNAVLDRSGKKDIRTALEVIAEVVVRTQGGSPLVKGMRGHRALINALLSDKDDALGLQRRVKEVAAQVSLRPQDLNDNLRDLYNRFAATFHGLDGPVVVVNNALIPEVNVRAALALYLDWGKVTYVYVEDGLVVESPYRLPSDPSIEDELHMSLPAIQDWVAENQELLTTKDLAIKKQGEALDRPGDGNVLIVEMGNE